MHFEMILQNPSQSLSLYFFLNSKQHAAVGNYHRGNVNKRKNRQKETFETRDHRDSIYSNCSDSEM